MLHDTVTGLMRNCARPGLEPSVSCIRRVPAIYNRATQSHALISPVICILPVTLLVVLPLFPSDFRLISQLIMGMQGPNGNWTDEKLA